MINILFDKDKYLGNINLVKRRYLKEDIFQGFKIKDVGKFILIKNG